MSDRDLLDEQIAYYRARAGEYDATSTPEGNPFAAHDAAIRNAIRAFDPTGHVLEIAAGTGQWTGQLAERATQLVVSDASPEMLDLNRARTGPLPNVRYVVSDAFSLEATRAHDVVFFGFFLSHVPPGAFDAFWGVLDGLLAPGGRVFLVDEGRHFLWREDWVDEEAGIVRRPVGDGGLHRAVKVLWVPEALEHRLDALGWTASVHPEGPFYWATAEK